MASCRLCGQTIRFDKTYKSEYTGKLIPLNEKVDEPHSCAAWKGAHRNYYPCRECGADIYFDDSHISKNGKHIPLDRQSASPHQCEDSKADSSEASPLVTPPNFCSCSLDGDYNI